MSLEGILHATLMHRARFQILIPIPILILILIPITTTVMITIKLMEAVSLVQTPKQMIGADLATVAGSWRLLA